MSDPLNLLQRLLAGLPQFSVARQFELLSLCAGLPLPEDLDSRIDLARRGLGDPHSTGLLPVTVEDLKTDGEHLAAAAMKLPLARRQEFLEAVARLIEPPSAHDVVHPLFSEWGLAAGGRDFMHDFGRVVHDLWTLWRSNLQAGRELFRFWTSQTHGPALGRSVQGLFGERDRARQAIEHLDRQGYEVRWAPIPADYVTFPTKGTSEDLWPIKTVYWVMARRRSGGVKIPNLPLTDLIETREGVPPTILKLDGREYEAIPEEESVLCERLLHIFQRPVLPAHLLWAFSVPRPDFRLARLEVGRRPKGDIFFCGTLTTIDGEHANEYMHSLFPFPAQNENQNEKWFVEGHGFNDRNDGLLYRYTQDGLGRASFQRRHPFFAHLGVDGYKLTATRIGSYAWPRLGFDFETPSRRDYYKIEFWKYLEERGYPLSAETRRCWSAISHAWEIASFRLDNGDAVGKDFLLRNSSQRFGENLPLTFWYHPDSPGWEVLL